MKRKRVGTREKRGWTKGNTKIIYIKLNGKMKGRKRMKQREEEEEMLKKNYTEWKERIIKKRRWSLHSKCQLFLMQSKCKRNVLVPILIQSKNGCIQTHGYRNKAIHWQRIFLDRFVTSFPFASMILTKILCEIFFFSFRFVFIWLLLPACLCASVRLCTLDLACLRLFLVNLINRIYRAIVCCVLCMHVCEHAKQTYPFDRNLNISFSLFSYTQKISHIYVRSCFIIFDFDVHYKLYMQFLFLLRWNTFEMWYERVTSVLYLK